MAFSKEGTFTLLERDRAIKAGQNGGRAKTKAKKVASRKNGRLSKGSKRNGRPRTRTLGEFLLRRKLNDKEHNALIEAVHRLTHIERSAFDNYFFNARQQYPELNVKGFDLPKKKPSQGMQHILKKFRLMAKWLLVLSNARPTRPPKDYAVIRVSKEEHERDAWERMHPNMPFVATRPQKIYFERMGAYKHLDTLLSASPTSKFSLESVMDLLRGSEKREDVAEALMEYLAFKHRPS